MSRAARQTASRKKIRPAALSRVDHDALEQAVLTLEYPSLVARLSGFVGRPVELVGSVLPKAASSVVSRASRVALRSALALRKARDHYEGGGCDWMQSSQVS